MLNAKELKYAYNIRDSCALIVLPEERENAINSDDTCLPSIDLIRANITTVHILNNNMLEPRKFLFSRKQP